MSSKERSFPGPWPAWSAGILLAGLGLRVALILGLGLDEVPYRGEVQRMARAFAESGFLGDPYMLPSGPSAHSPPIYPVLVAPVYLFSPDPETADRVLLYLNAALAALQFALVPWVARRFGMSPRIGVAAGMAGAILPVHLLAEVRGGEAPLAGLVLIGLLMLPRDWCAGPWPTLVLGGMATGVAVLANPAFVLLLPGLAWLNAGCAKGWDRLSRLACAGLVCGLVVAPWAVRNYLTLGGIVPVRSNFGIEFRMSNHPGARADMVANVQVPESIRVHPTLHEEAARRIVREGEVAYNRRLKEEAVVWLVSEPGAFARLTGRRILNFWLPPAPEPLRGAALAALALGGWIGLAWARRSGLPGSGLQIMTWISFPLVYYLVQSAPRYRYPLTWAFLLYSAWALSRVAANWKSRGALPGRQPETPDAGTESG